MPFSIPTPHRLRGALLTMLLFVVVVGGVLSTKVVALTEPSATDGLPHSSQSWIVAQRQATLPHAQSQPAVIVYSRADGRPLTSAQLAGLQTQVARLATSISSVAPRSAATALGPLVANHTRTVALVSISVATTPNSNAVSNRILALRRELHVLTPAGIESHVTGAPAFTTDLGQVFKGADLTLLFATVVVVALLLVLTYRSPLLWIIPLVVVAMADQVAAHLASLGAPHVGIRLDGSSTGIAQVLVFGAGTDYALLLIARYRDQLRHSEDRFAAMREAVSRTAESVFASGATVTISLALLLLASMASTRALGFGGAIGIAVAMAFSLVVLPSLLLLCGRWAFWPLVPRVGETRHRDGRVFARVGAFVERRTALVIISSVAFLLLAASLGLGSKVGLSTTQQFTATPESVVGQGILASAFPAGSSDPVVIITSTSAVAGTSNAVRSVSGVTRVVSGPHDSRWTELDVATTATPGSAASYATIDALRAAVATVPGARAAVGGDTATSLDADRATNNDTWLLVPLILLVVLGVLIVLLGAIVAPLLLLLTVITSFFAALGLSWLIFQHVAHYPALASGVSFYGFLFLVALGVDYNIFLSARAKEETTRLGTTGGMLMALRSTGGVITSAGIVLASVFAVLGVLPLIQLTQIGTIVCVGVLLDTLLVRTVLVPALAIVLGDRFWWPRRRSAPLDPSP